MILKNKVAFMICILYKELKDLSGLLQRSACIAEVLGKFLQMSHKSGRQSLVLNKGEVTTDLARYSCSVCLHSIFQYAPSLLLFSDTHW